MNSADLRILLGVVIDLLLAIVVNIENGLVHYILTFSYLL